MGEAPVLLMRLPLPDRTRTALWMREPCTAMDCQAVINIGRLGDRLLVQHGENPEHVVLIDDPADGDSHDFDAAICEIRSWLVRVHGAQMMAVEP